MSKFYVFHEEELYLFCTGEDGFDMDLFSSLSLFRVEQDWMLSASMFICRGIDTQDLLHIKGRLEGEGYKEVEVERSTLESWFKSGIIPETIRSASSRKPR